MLFLYYFPFVAPLEGSFSHILASCPVCMFSTSEERTMDAPCRSAEFEHVDSLPSSLTSDDKLPIHSLDAATNDELTFSSSWTCVTLDLRLRRPLLRYGVLLLGPLLVLTLPLLILLLVSPARRVKIPAMMSAIVIYTLVLQLVRETIASQSASFPILCMRSLVMYIIVYVD